MRSIIVFIIFVLMFFLMMNVSAQNIRYNHIRANSLAVVDSVKIGSTWLTEKDVQSIKPEGRGVEYPPMSKKDFYEELNKIRTSYGYPPLKSSGRLEFKARFWLDFLDRHNLGMVHDTNTNDGEVLTNAYEYLNWWMKSPRHKAVLLGKKWKKIGLAEKDGVYCARLD